MSLSLKPNKPKIFSGERDFLKVHAWLYQVEEYFYIVELGKTEKLGEASKVRFAALLFEGPAAVWWFTKVTSGPGLKTWKDFKEALVQEFAPPDSYRQSRMKLKRLCQKTSVEAYLSVFRSTVIGIPDMAEAEKLDRLCDGLKRGTRLEVLKANVYSFEQAAQVALNIDRVLFRVQYGGCHGIPSKMSYRLPPPRVPVPAPQSGAIPAFSALGRDELGPRPR